MHKTITRNTIKGEYKHVIRLDNRKGHDIKIYPLLEYVTPTYTINNGKQDPCYSLYVYTFDLKEIGQVALCLGFHPIGNITTSDAIINKYTDKYDQISHRYLERIKKSDGTWKSRYTIEKSKKQSIKRLLTALIKDCI